MTSLNGWHRGELIVRKKLGLDKIPATNHLWSSIRGEMPEQHSTFYTTRLPFVPVCVLDDEGRPWGSILAGGDGKPGFIRHPRYDTLSIEARLWKGDPFHKAVDITDYENGSKLIAGIGVEVSTRRRNKFAGGITGVDVRDGDLSLQLVVNEAIGNCPKYITLRDLTPFPAASSVIAEDRPHLAVGERLSDAAIALILESDTVFFGTVYSASREDSSLYPSHLGMNHRGGRPGFIRVKPSDGRTVVLPDFSGNRFMTSLGNVEATPYASLTFISFTTGDILYLTGNARNVYGSEAGAIMPFQDTLTEIFITGYTLVQNAFPLRQSTEEIVGSPYSPPIKLLAEEATQAKMFSVEQQPTALLTRITVHSSTIATFEWESSVALRVVPGQAAILDFRPLFGQRQYQHMSAQNPNLVNDDFIRTWTISSAAAGPGDAENKRFALTIREKPGGIVTGAMFKMVRKLVEEKPELLGNATPLSFNVNIAGITGDFVLPAPPKLGVVQGKDVRHLLWVAGGIGVTPFLSMLSALSQLDSTAPTSFDITLAISTREPEIMVSLLQTAIGSGGALPNLSIHLFTNVTLVASDESSGLPLSLHRGRITASFFDDKKHLFDKGDTEFYLCGPEPFERSILDLLAKFDVTPGNVHREGFAY
ncbi:hypothetical protein BDN70DRAFT_884841 [Pholiota conissans]|uniref:Oxidoreductase FAD/NAD(P)-binding domain-containing protein n=1 Tax=Pholiota conissans TaxID=109636 RepID=A0A9P6CWB3_9AGAR|nr:hypothetical protein BDN70DRAFT_884841 [Pholiota conissans]